MNFAFSEEQEMIRKSAKDFVKTHSSMERIRELFDDEAGYSPSHYQQMVDAGWVGMVYPENYGGIDLGYVDLICITEELGAGLIPEPLTSNALLGGNAILFSCDEGQKSTLLPQIAAGELKVTLAAYELAGRYNLAHVETTATADGSDFILNGSKAFVPDAATSDKLLISARVSGGTTDREGITLFIVDRDAPGVTITPIKTMDHRRRAMIGLKDVRVSGDSSGIIGRPERAIDALEKTIDRATVGLCAEMLGGMQAALAMSVAYSKERVQFGKPIGSFQAIKHKAADMFVDMEIARSAVYYAAMAVDQDMPDLCAAVSCAKALCSDAYLHIAKDAIQIHGGIGYTDECDVQLYYKRAVVSGVTFGDATYHRDRYATLKGF